MSELETRWRELVRGETRALWAGPARAALAALALLYGGAVRAWRLGVDLGGRRTRLPCRVLSIGNLTVGGTGKTTMVRWTARRLLEWGARPAVLSYGYRAAARPTGKEIVVASGPEGLRAGVETTGDEPQLLARSLPGVPVLVGRRRVLSGRHACTAFGVDVCVLDDGFQYWRLEKDLEILLLDAAEPFGNGRLLPRGELREPVAALRRADAAVLTHADRADPAARARLRERLRRAGLVVAEARHAPRRLRDLATGETVSAQELRSGRWLALSALGRPESFERTLEALGAREFVPARFPDHHAYTEAEFERLRRRVRSEGLAGVLTTEKDSVKIPPGWLEGIPCRVVEIDLEFMSGQDAIERLLRERIVG